jgi:CheY-like chemotaxis protein
MEQILMNLVSNARDAMPQGGRLIITTANVIVDEPDQIQLPPIPGRYVRLQVRDTGVGIAEDVLPKIFEPFFTTKEEGKGTGLGLATVHGIVQQSHGSIFVESHPGRGATFTIYLPKTAEAAAPEASVEAARAARAVSDRILLVETDPIARESDVRVLTDAGYHVTAVSTPEQALATLAADGAPVRLLVSEVAMPGMTGLVLAERIRAGHPALPVVFTTDPREAKIDPVEIFEHGDLLVKPFTAMDLIGKVREALRTSES